MEVKYKIAETEDFDELWSLVEESLADRDTKLSRDRLQEDLSGIIGLNTEQLASQREDTTIELDLEQARLTHPICYAILAKVDDQSVGYLIFHRYYSTWESRTAFINMIYVNPAFRGMGIATGLWLELNKFCTNEHLAYVFYETSRIDSGLRDTLAKHGSFVYRDDNSD